MKKNEKKKHGFSYEKKNANFEKFCKQLIEHKILISKHVFLPFTDRLLAVNYQNLPFTAGKSK